MAKFMFFLSFFLFVLVLGDPAYDFVNVLDHGAIGDGLTDDSLAFDAAFTMACDSSSPSVTILVPGGSKSFLLQPMHFNGKHCRPSMIFFQIDGYIVAPSDPNAWHRCDGEKCHAWLEFQHFDGLYIQGSGTFNGQGRNWWNPSCHQDNIVCAKKPTGFVISHSNNVHLTGLNFEDSPQMHIAFEHSTRVYVSQLTIRAPAESPNTDGIHIQQSSYVSIDHTFIGTGDDCVSIGDGSSHLEITNIVCGPGHGISIGSLGKHGDKETVEYVNVRNVTFTGTQNGVRIKTWQGGKGYAKNMMFENIVSNGAKYPIIIDQYYCDHTHCKNQTSAVHISNITYKNIEGTSEKQIAVKLACSISTPCKNIIMENIDLKPASHGEANKFNETSSYCLNVRGRSNRHVYPKVPCLYIDNNL
ncbi:hypothetical protein JRO89_XS11G0158600 [Xanthoceras sorbifolium]|uniref:Polygalacturonase n=1 Tax=Xanthoceras sorbifolium TaxID=99658 RepID=A0ABQ8HFR2_9ROSI|nr:hypothetical protein JRO89_XS11G0158600 [Xanthoceras sorbifolium]